MNRQNSLEILNKCLEEIRNTTVEEYENIKKEKKLNFEELYSNKNQDSFKFITNRNYSLEFTDNTKKYLIGDNKILTSDNQINILDEIPKSA